MEQDFRITFEERKFVDSALLSKDIFGPEGAFEVWSLCEGVLMSLWCSCTDLLRRQRFCTSVTFWEERLRGTSEVRACVRVCVCV